MGVLHACVAAEPAVWRHRVRRIAGQEHTSILIALRVVGHRAPCRDIVDLHRHVRYTHGGAHQLDTARLGDVIGDPGRFRPRGVAHGVDCEKARPTGFFQRKNPRSTGLKTQITRDCAAQREAHRRGSRS